MTDRKMDKETKRQTERWTKRQTDKYPDVIVVQVFYNAVIPIQKKILFYLTNISLFIQWKNTKHKI